MRAAVSCNSGPYTVWLDFDGANVTHAASDDATTDPVQSLLASSAVAFPAFDSSVAAPRVSRQQAIDAIVDRVRTQLHGYAVDVTTARPTAAPYSVVLVGGTHASIGVPSGEGGLAQEDCGNLSDRDVSYVFAADIAAAHGGVVAIADTVLHEVGHAFGLLHTVEQRDLMYSAASPPSLPELFTAAYAQGNYSSYAAGDPTPVPRPCAGSDPVDNAALMTCNAGARTPTGDVTPPTLTWDAPAATTMTVLAPLLVTFSASDDVGVARLEVYKNLELVAVLTAPPYQATIDAMLGEQFYVTVEAIDAAANRTTLTRAFGAIVADDMGAPRPDMARAPAKAHGCSLGGAGGAIPSLPLACLALLWLRAWSRSSGSASSARRRR
jgi:hypothetical protein